MKEIQELRFVSITRNLGEMKLVSATSCNITPMRKVPVMHMDDREGKPGGGGGILFPWL